MIERLKAKRTMEQQLAAALLRIVEETQKTDHIPPITTNEANPFPYQVNTVYPTLANGRLLSQVHRVKLASKGKAGVLF